MNGPFVAGIVAAEGSFTRSGDRRFRFAVHVALDDVGLCHALAVFFGVGRVYSYPRRRPHYKDEAVYVVQSLPELAAVVAPFMDRHLPPGERRTQFELWRLELAAYLGRNPTPGMAHLHNDV